MGEGDIRRARRSALRAVLQGGGDRGRLTRGPSPANGEDDQGAVPNACNVVEGEVSPDGWCKAYAMAD